MPATLLGRPLPVPLIDAAAYDADAMDYILRVESADAAPLERPVRVAINTLVTGLKSDGVWQRLGAACILAGARTLAGILVPLVGPAPSPANFVQADYSRRNGLVGNGSNKSLNSNRAQNADPQDDVHMSVYATAAATNASGFPVYLGVGSGSAGDCHIFVLNNATDIQMRMRSATPDTFTGRATATGLIGFSRTQGHWFAATAGASFRQFARASQASRTESTRVFSSLNVSTGVANLFSNARLSWYSIGRAVDLPALQSRLDTFMASLRAAI
jgi:hypothetical protein